MSALIFIVSLWYTWYTETQFLCSQSDITAVRDRIDGYERLQEDEYEIISTTAVLMYPRKAARVKRFRLRIVQEVRVRSFLGARFIDSGETERVPKPKSNDTCSESS